MRRRTSALRSSALTAFVALGLLATHLPIQAGNPRGAVYSPATDRVFWFVHVSDTHIGASGSQDSSNLTWLVTTGKSVIAPSFMVATGDLTDSTNGNIFGYPNGPYQAEWDQYKNILAGRVDADFYYDLPGNHDAYNDRTFAYYRANSIQGRAKGGTQISWTKTFPFGTYHFLGVNTADNTGNSFSLSWPWGDYAGLDETELGFVADQLAANSSAQLTMVFGHHPVTDTGVSNDTWLYYGCPGFIGALDLHGASLYGYGHTHRQSDIQFAGDAYTGPMANGGVRYENIASLGKSSSLQYDVVAVDCNGVSSVPATVGTWPVVLITAPVSRLLGATVNPYSYDVPAASDNPIRALAFDAIPVSSVQFRIDAEATWHAMSAVAGNPRLWQGTWNASTLAAGDHTITVQATGTSTRSHTITVRVNSTVPPNNPPVAVNDAYATDQGTALSLTAPGVLANDSDADSDSLTASLVTSPAHGNVDLSPDGSFTYTPNTGFSGTDSFAYTASDGTASSAPATVSITVRSIGPDIVKILAASYTAKTRKLHVEATSTAQPEAVLTVVGYGGMTWDPVNLRYILDKRVAAAPAGTITVSSSLGGFATYTLGGGANVAPVAGNQNVTVPKDTAKAITLAASDANGDPLTYAVVSAPAHGVLTGTAPNMIYTPAVGYTGSDSFTFKANDGKLDSNVATVTITVKARKN